MNLRTARKVVLRAHPRRYPVAMVLRAIRRVERACRRAPNCPKCDCPANPKCERFRTCNLEAAASCLAMDIETGHHPWGQWVCMMQRAAGIGAPTPPPPA